MRNIRFYILRIKELPVRILLKKVLIKPIAFIFYKTQGLKVKFSHFEISDMKFLENLAEIDSLPEVIENIRGERPSFFIDISLRKDVITRIKEVFPELQKQIVSDADKICLHVFDILGSGDSNLSEFIETHGGRENCSYLPWHFDFKTGYRWHPGKFYKDIEIPYGKADIKVPWELSRFYHAITLGQAYWLTENEKYAREFVEQVDNWIENNPPKLGVNWRCTMDVAIRVTNFIWGYYFFRESSYFTDDFLVKFLKSMLAHGKHIMSNLEIYDGLTTNHYISNIVGLVYLGILFPEFKESKKWREFGIKELIREMKKQVYSDGVDFEASTCYHRLVLELFFFSTLIVVINEKDFKGDNYAEFAQEIFGKEYVQKLYKMFDFVLYVLKPNGKMPQIGDNDNGRLHILGKRELLDFTYLLAYAALFFDDSKFKIKEFDFVPEVLWLFGSEGYKRWRKMSGSDLKVIQSKAFTDGGIYVIRHKKDYMVISAGPNGQNGKGGHSHNDKLSFELHLESKDIIVDPGTYLYTPNPKWRQQFRSTAYHNTVEVNDKEQNRFRSSLFELRNDTKVKINKLFKNEEIFVFDAQHNGYERLPCRVLHRRRFFLNKRENYWIINDMLSGKGRCKSNLYFHLAPKIKIMHGSNNRSILILSTENRENIVFYVEGSRELNTNLIETYVSSGYGVKKESIAIRCSNLGVLPMQFTTIIYPVSERYPESIPLEVEKFKRFMIEILGKTKI